MWVSRVASLTGRPENFRQQTRNGHSKNDYFYDLSFRLMTARKFTREFGYHALVSRLLACLFPPFCAILRLWLSWGTDLSREEAVYVGGQEK